MKESLVFLLVSLFGRFRVQSLGIKIRSLDVDVETEKFTSTLSLQSSLLKIGTVLGGQEG